MLIQLIENNLRDFPAFEGYDNANFLVRLIPNVSDARNRLVDDQMVHPLKQLVFLYLIRDFRYDYLFPFRSCARCRRNSFYERFGTDSDTASASGVHLLNATGADYNSRSRKIRTRDVLHERFGISIRIRKFTEKRINHFGEVMRRYAG